MSADNSKRSVPYCAQGRIWVRQHRAECQTVEIDESGLLLLSPIRCAPGTPVRVDLPLPGYRWPLPLAAIVLRETDVGGEYALELRFESALPGSREALSGFLRDERERAAVGGLAGERGLAPNEQGLLEVETKTDPEARPPDPARAPPAIDSPPMAEAGLPIDSAPTAFELSAPDDLDLPPADGLDLPPADALDLPPADALEPPPRDALELTPPVEPLAEPAILDAAEGSAPPPIDLSELDLPHTATLGEGPPQLPDPRSAGQRRDLELRLRAAAQLKAIASRPAGSLAGEGQTDEPVAAGPPGARGPLRRVRPTEEIPPLTDVSESDPEAPRAIYSEEEAATTPQDSKLKRLFRAAVAQVDREAEQRDKKKKGWF